MSRGCWPLLLLLASGCGTAPAPSLTSSEAASFGADDDEKTILQRAANVDATLDKKGLILPDAAVEAYVAAVGSRVAPPAAARIVTFSFRVVRDPLVNAFALPNGSIYVNVGLLARLENEAQLAQVLGHEVSHVVRRHALERYRTRRNVMIFANIADTALFGTSIAYIPALGTLASYSRENEAEADRLGLEYMSAAGYPIGEAERLFQVIQEVKPRESLWGSVYSSHPDNQERATQMHDIVATGKLPLNTGGRLGADEYPKIRHAATLENVRLKLNIRQYQLAVDSAEAGLGYAPKSAWLHYYRGEAYRLMADDPEGAAREHALINGTTLTKELIAEFRAKQPAERGTAKQSYDAALAIDPQLAEAYRGLGLLSYAQGDPEAARTALLQYLEKGRNVPDNRYIKSVLDRMEKP